MDRYQSLRHPPHRKVHRSSARFVVTVVLTTAVAATGGFGTLPDNPVTNTLREEIGKNVPEEILNPVNAYLDHLSAPTIPPQPASQPNHPLDLIGFLIDDITPEPSVTVIDSTPSSTLVTTSETPTARGTATVTASLTLTRTATSTRTLTPTLTATQTFTPTLTATQTPTFTSTPICSAPSTTFVNTTFFNSSAQTINIYWVDFSCNLILYSTLGPEQSIIQGTYIGHLWQFKDASTGQLFADYVVSSANQVVDVSTGAVTIETPAPTATATTPQFVGFYVSAVDLNGSGSVTTVSPGASVVVTYNFQVFSDPCPTCWTQLVTGLGSSGSHGGTCAYHGIPGVSPGVTGSENVTLTAPSTPGTYSVIVEYHWQFTCADALANYGGGGVGLTQGIGQIIVP